MTIDNTLTHAASDTPACPYCFTPADGEAVACPACGAAHHADCYAEAGACAVYGCADSADRREDGQSAGAGSAPPVPSINGASRAIAEALRSSTSAAPTLPPPPVGATPVSTVPPPVGATPVSTLPPASGAAQGASYRQATCGTAPAGPAPRPVAQQGASAAMPAPPSAADAGSGSRCVVVGGTASATIHQGKLLVATSEGVQYQFQL